MARNPIKDQVAIVGVGATPFGRDLGAVTPMSLAVDACCAAIRDAGLTASDIDGMCGAPGLVPEYVQEGVGIPQLTWWGTSTSPVHAFRLIDAMHAVFSGACDYALVYHSLYRSAHNSRLAASDPIRVRTNYTYGRAPSPFAQFAMPYGNRRAHYGGWMARYMHDYGATREDFGMFCINGRSNAALNPHAVLRTPMTMDDYLGARMIHEPMCLFDMDLPVDGADALVLTTAERAKDRKQKPVYIHATAYGQLPETEEEQALDLQHFGQQAAMRALWDKSDLQLADVDVFFPYDGFSVIGINWIENVGYCGPGEAGAFMRQHWSTERARIEINGRVLVNPHGGALNEGATQGSGHIREAVTQLRGAAGARQIPGCRTALVTPGGFFHNSTAMILRSED